MFQATVTIPSCCCYGGQSHNSTNDSDSLFPFPEKRQNKSLCLRVNSTVEEREREGLLLMSDGFSRRSTPFLIHYAFCGESLDKQRRIIFKFKLAINGHLPLGNEHNEGGRYQSQVSFCLLGFRGNLFLLFFFEKKRCCAFFPRPCVSGGSNPRIFVSPSANNKYKKLPHTSISMHHSPTRFVIGIIANLQFWIFPFTRNCFSWQASREFKMSKNAQKSTMN